MIFVSILLNNDLYDIYFLLQTCEAMQQMVSPTVLHHNLSIIKEASSARSLESLENIHWFIYNFNYEWVPS